MKKKLRTVEILTDMDIVPFVSSEQYPTSVYIFNELNISLRPVKKRGRFVILVRA